MRLRRFIREDDAPANSAGAGRVAGIRPGDDPVVYPAAQKRWTDETGKTFAGARVFETDMETVLKHRDGKHPSHRYDRRFSEPMRASGRAEEVRAYGRKNSKKNIVLKDAATGTMVYLRRPKPGGLRESTEMLQEAVTVEDLDKVIQHASALAMEMHVFNEFYAASKFPHVNEIQSITHRTILKSLGKELREFEKLYRTASK
jgi:hypothetical protein